MARIRVSRTNIPGGEVLEEAFRIFTFESEGVTKKAISLQVTTFGDGPGITEVTCFDPDGQDGLVDAFMTGTFFSPEDWDYVPFKVPAIGDYVRMSGVHYEKWTKLTKSENPELRKGFWKSCMRCYDASKFLVRSQPAKPTGRVTKVKAV
jgi:hypothetical protein